MNSHRELSIDELNTVSGGEKNAQGKPIPPKEKKPVDPGPDSARAISSGHAANA